VSGAAAGALGTMLVMITAAGCRDGAQSGGSGGTGDGVARTPTLAGQLPRVAASASLERADEWVPAHGVWLGVDGTIVVAPTPERWAALATGGLAGRRVALAELASVVAVARDEDKQRHDQAQGRERAREAATERAGLIAGGLTPEQADERMANTHVDYGDIVLGPVYAERPPSTIPIAGDLAPVRDGAPARAVVLTAAPADPNPTEPFLLVPAARAPARALVEALLTTAGGLVAVAAPDGPRALRLRIKHAGKKAWWPDEFAWTPWVELRVGRDAIELEVVPGTRQRLPGPVDSAVLRQALTTARAQAGVTDQTVDVLVGDADVQRLVDVLAALDASVASEVGLGLVPTASDDATRRGAPRALVPMPALEPEGLRRDLRAVRAAVRPQLDAVRACFAVSPSPATLHVVLRVSTEDGPPRTVIVGDPSPLATCVHQLLAAPLAAAETAVKLTFVRHDPR
jgi:hypothetical protein